MKKIWIIHNSLHGNSEQISRTIANDLKNGYEVSLDSIKNITPEDIAKDDPYGLIIATRIVAFRSDNEIREFIKNLDRVITNPISKVAYFSTHALGWKNFFIKGMKKTLDKAECIGEICPDFLEVKMEKAEGPAVQGADAKIGEFISTLREFMQ
ncbi:MAG: flavodoxin family protein [Candidatus Lokiarchaeota archaeon]|nr:flavodoxin family protein [Candidatus Lokiarchaeota archaeon]